MFRVLLFVIAGRIETAVDLPVCTVWGRRSALLTDDCLVIFKIFIKRSPTKCLSPFMTEMFVNNQLLSRIRDTPRAL